LWRLATAYPARTLSLLAGACLLAMIIMTSQNVDDERSCRLEQWWEAGTVHDNQELGLHRDGKGLWRQSDRHGEWERRAFRWKRRGSDLIISFDDQHRTVPFQLQRRGDTCVLTFDDAPLPGSFLEFYGS
jgi:hypothetical protein